MNGMSATQGDVVAVFAEDAVATVMFRVTPTARREEIGWARGPWPLRVNATTATQAIRTTYFHPRAAATLYGSEQAPTRWWTAPDRPAKFRGVDVLAVEYVWNDKVRDAGLRSASAYLLLHVGLGSCVTETLARLAFAGGDAFDTDDEDLRTLADGWCELPAESRSFRQRTTTVCFARLTDSADPPPYAMNIDVSARSQWLFALASATPPDRFHPDPDEPLPPETALSRSWRGMVLRDGAAFLGRPEPDAFLDGGVASALVQSVYVDAILLGRMQLDALSGIAEAIARVNATDSATASTELRDIQYWLDDVRSNLWWERVTHHGPANEILSAFQAQHRTQDLLQEVVAELADRVRFHGMLQDETTNRLLNVIAVIGFPIGVGLAVAQIVTSAGYMAAAVSLLVSALVAVVISLSLQRRFATNRRTSDT